MDTCIEFLAPGTPLQNGAVERAFAKLLPYAEIGASFQQ